MAISNLIKTVQDIMRQDVGVDGDAQRIAQLVWMAFLKIFDDKEMELEIREDDYRSPLPEGYRWRNWAADEEGMTGDDLLEFVNDKLFPTLKEFPTDGYPRGMLVKSVFEDSYNYMKSGTLMRQIINKINEIDFNSTEDHHLFNEFYETFLRDLQSAGNAGEYYTPRAVTQFMVDMTAPKLGEKILDPACGTGGFLVSTLEALKNQATSIESLQIAQESIYGIEKKPLPHSLCVTNLILHDVEIPNVVHDNSLSRPLRDYGRSDMVDVIVTNPPFGGIEEEGIQGNFPASYRTKETADLFIVLILTLLKERGRAAVVLPDGFLFGEGVKTRIKAKLLEECNLHTIVRLPNGVFAPYTGIQTNLLFFTKGEPTRDIWYFEHPYPEGQKSYSKTKPIRIEEFELEKQWWNNRIQNEFAWKISIDDVKKRNYNLDISHPGRTGKDIVHSSTELLDVLKSSIAEHTALLEKVKETLGLPKVTCDTVKLGEVVSHNKEFITIVDQSEYKRCKVKLHRQGIVLRDIVKGSDIKTKKQYVCKTGQLLVAEIDAKVGGYGIVPQELHGAIVSSHYYLYDVDINNIDLDYLAFYLKTDDFFEQIKPQGSTNYAAIRARDVLNITIPLPDMSEQQKIVSKLDSCNELMVSIQQLLVDTDKFFEAVLKETFAIQQKRASNMSPPAGGVG